MSQLSHQRYALSIALALLGLLATAGTGWLFLARAAAGSIPGAARPLAAAPGAPPALPSSLYGYVDGAEVGALIAAAVDGVVVAEARAIESQGRPFYAINVPADDPATPAVEGGGPGATIELRVDGQPAGSAAWEPGGNLALDLPALATP